MGSKYVTLNTIKFGEWLVKASLMDDQILLVGLRPDGLGQFVRIFYDEKKAHGFIESLSRRTAKPVE